MSKFAKTIILDAKEIKRRDKVFKDASASCAIEGLKLSKKDRVVVKELYRSCKTTDEMVMHFKNHMNIKS